MPAPEATASPVVAAFTFLTRLPLGGDAVGDSDALVRAAPLFPVVGGLLGLAVGATAIGLAELLPALLAGLLAVALELLLTGALHADGLADSADGLGGSDREHALAIMRDHALGAYGACALLLDLTIKAVAIGALAEAQALGPVVGALALSRAAPLPLARLLPYAREGEGVGRVLAGRVGTRPVLSTMAIALGIALLAAGLDGLPLALGAVAATAVVGALAHRRLDGVTGDVMGAAVELSAAAGLLVALMVG